ncbi:MAG: DUF6134 family protein [Alphaproteobacteria bacterium]
MLGFGVLLSLVVAAQGWARVPDGTALEYQVLRRGKEIGRHRVWFRYLDDRLQIETRVRVAVKFAFITVFRFELDGYETWRDGRLIAMRSTTNDNGERHAVRAVANGTTIDVEADGRKWSAPATSVPSSLWHRDMVNGSPLLSVKLGKPLEVDIEEVGRETVSARGGEVSATHYVVSGDIDRDLWYDDDGFLVHLRLGRGDGVDIVYVLL